MKSYKKYLCIYLPIVLLCLLINHLKKHDDTPANIPYHLFSDFEKTEYDVKDLVTGEKIGDFNLDKNETSLLVHIQSNSTSGTLMIGEYGDYYEFDSVNLSNVKIEKNKFKNLEYYVGFINEWYTFVIMNLDPNDSCDYYESNNKKRYLLYIVKNGDYNFTTKSESVHDAYISLGAFIKRMKYAAILE